MGSKSSSSSSAQTTSQADNRVVAGDGATVLGSGSSLSSSVVYDSDYSAYVNDADSTTYTDSRQTFTDSRDQSITDNSSRYSYADSSQAYTDNSSAYSYSDSSQAYTDNSSAYSYADNSLTDSRAWYAYDSSDRSVTATDDRSWYSYASDSSDRSVTTINNTGTDAGAVRLAELQRQLLGEAFTLQTDATKTLAGFGFEGLAAMGESVTNLADVAGRNNARAWEQTIDASGQLIDRLLTSAERQSDGARALAQGAISSFQPTENKTAGNWPLIVAAAAAGLVAVSFIMRKA